MNTIDLLVRTTLVTTSLLLAGCLHATAWTDEEKSVLSDLRLRPEPVSDPSNRYADDPWAAGLGQRLFFDRRLSSTGTVACATCHVPSRDFQDGLPLARGVGTTNRRTMPLAGLGASPWLFWDGRKDSLWAQALGPLESEVEHGGDRVQYVRLIGRAYAAEYRQVFGALPDLTGLPEHASPNGSPELADAWDRIPPDRQEEVTRVFANIGKAIAAYERKLQPGPSRFDLFVDAVLSGDTPAAEAALNPEERAGLRLFIGKANCIQCHNGPRFTNDDFANTGVPAAPALPADAGRLLGASEVLQDEFNCRSRYSDARPEQCRELRSLRPGDTHLDRQFKVPSLRNVAGRAPFMHAGQLATLEDVVAHYDRAPGGPTGHSELVPLELSPRERTQLVQFLLTLSAPLATQASWLADPGTP